MTQYQAWVRCLVREKALAGRTLAPVPRCPGAALTLMDTRLGHGWAAWHGSSWHPGDHDTDVMMSRCHGHLNTSTVRHPPSVTEPHLRQARHCLSVYIYTCLAVVLNCLTVCVFLRFYFDNQTIIMLTLHSQETPNNTDQVGATVVTWLSRWARDTWHLCHESVAPVVTSGLLSQLAGDHQSSHLGGQRALICVLFWP